MSRKNLKFHKMKKVLTICGAILFASLTFTSCGGGSKNVDICKCLTDASNSKYMQENNDACRDAISKEIGVDNWEQVNMSQNPDVSAKFDALAKRCQ
jgi:hypothetical protein